MSVALADSIAAWLFRHDLRGAVRFHRTVCGQKPLGVHTKHGVHLELNPYEYVDRCVIRFGFYEEEVLKAVLSELRPGEVFWDVGANIGLHALTVARLVPDVRVWAFEPHLALAESVSRAARVNGADVEVLTVALDAVDGESDFYVHEGNAGRSSLHNHDNDPTLRAVRVRTMTADSLIAGGIPAPNVMKIDVEGNEARLLDGAAHLLRDPTLRAVVFEDVPDPQSPVMRALANAGFTIARLGRLEATHHNLDNYLASRTTS